MDQHRKLVPQTNIIQSIIQQKYSTMATRPTTRTRYEPAPGSKEDLATQSSSVDSRRSQPRQHKEKSELCKKFMEKGSCPYGTRCKFAHGSHELRQNNNHNGKYKTKECITFFTACQCRFGERCNFLHLKHHPHTPSSSFSSALEQYPDLMGWAFAGARNSSRLFAINKVL